MRALKPLYCIVLLMSERGQMSGHVSASGSLLQVRALSTVRCRGWRHVSTEPLVDV